MQYISSCFCRYSFNQFSHSVMSDSLWPHGLQHAKPPSPTSPPELTQTPVHWISDAIRPSGPLLCRFPPVFSLSQYQGLFQATTHLIRWPKFWSFSISSASYTWGLNRFVNFIFFPNKPEILETVLFLVATVHMSRIMESQVYIYYSSIIY